MLSNHFSTSKRNSQPVKAGILLLFFLILVALMVSGCQSLNLLGLNTGSEKVTVSVEKNGRLMSGVVDKGSTVEQALTSLEILYQPEDIVSPAPSTILNEDASIRITVITFEEDTDEQIIPFKSQTVRNESIPEGETYIIQTGENGLEEVTTKSTFENGELVSKVISNRSVIKDSIPEILMYGVQAEYAPIQISGKIIYISNGSAWMLEASTGNRTPLITSGDLDGRILDLSSNGEWLLYSRKVQNDEINSLWMLHFSDWTAKPVSLRISNVVHFAAWLPGEALRIVYSTVTPQDSAPGWKANNDLLLRIVSDSGMIMSDDVILESSESGEYSWWGTEFYLSEDGRTLLSVSPDSIGEVDRLTGERKELVKIQPYEKTRSDWAWIPGVSWSADGNAVYFNYHGEIDGSTRSYDPTDFNIGKIDRESMQVSELQNETGLFSYPAASPVFEDNSAYVVYMQAINPLQSESSRYRIMLMDENGLNTKVVFPLDAEDYVTPQKLIWAPTTDTAQTWVALIYESNIWLVNPFTGIYNQITIDQSVTKMIWE